MDAGPAPYWKRLGPRVRILENLRSCHRANYRAVEYGGARQGLSPFCARGIDGEQIPQRSVSFAAILLRLADADSAIAFATACSLSQNCLTLRSDKRPSAAVVGGIQSVGRIGSQTANTLTFVSGCCSSNFSTAEDPRRHTGHVGESSRTILGPSADRLKSTFREPSDPIVNSASGAWPAGT